ncbi:MAG: Trk system potassium transporter TrkA [Rhodospirillaceae bacterium]|nr:Trk system potassium transporter TrkA [Rhodospirillaceae bacterium]
MKVIVCGAGQVGSNIARHLSEENNDVTVIDHDAERIRRVGDTLDVQAMLGFASHPDILEQAGASAADMVVAVTASDEINMVACQVCHSLFNVPTKIARIRHQSYLQPVWADLFSRENLPIDVIISPEVEVARAVARRLEVPGALDMIGFADDTVRLIAVRLAEDCPVAHTPLRQLTELFPDLNITVVYIIRADRGICPTSLDQMLPGDEVYFIADAAHVDRAMDVFGQRVREARRLIILGGGNIGFLLARQLETLGSHVDLKLIEADRTRAEYVAEHLNRTTVINGDALDRDILEEANIASVETVIAVSNNDEVNILASVMAKRYGSGRSIVLINTGTYAPIMAPLGIDAAVSPREITVSSILQHVRRGRIRSVYTLREGDAEVIEAEAMETSPLVGKPLRDINLPNGILVGAVVRGREVLIPRGSTVVKEGDRVIMFAVHGMVKKVEKMFSVALGFF